MTIDCTLCFNKTLLDSFENNRNNNSQETFGKQFKMKQCLQTQLEI